VPVVDLARRIRHSPLLAERDLLWSLIRPPYRALLRLQSRAGGVRRVVNGETLRLRYPYSEVDAAYERKVVEAFRSFLEDDSVVLDVGAAWGMYSLLAASRCPSGRVYAFEPVLVNARAIEDHAVLNGVADRVAVVEAVMDEHDGSAPL
jgi:hypothetical protein